LPNFAACCSLDTKAAVSTADLGTGWRSIIIPLFRVAPIHPETSNFGVQPAEGRDGLTGRIFFLKFEGVTPQDTDADSLGTTRALS
jgi:hypothetical protein